jgi:hypothetical protein
MHFILEVDNILSSVTHFSVEVGRVFVLCYFTADIKNVDRSNTRWSDNGFAMFKPGSKIDVSSVVAVAKRLS